MAEFTVIHKQIAGIEAENREEAYTKAVEGDTESGWNTQEIQVEPESEPELEKADREKIQEIMEENINEGYAEVLEEHGIETGDIRPERLIEMDKKEQALIDETAKWVETNKEVTE